MSTPVSPTVQSVKVDATQRGLRTLVQGAVAAVVVAVLPVVSTVISSGIDKVNWQVLEVSTATAAVMALSAYVMAFVKPAIPNPEVEKAVEEAITAARDKVLTDIAALAPPVEADPVVEVPKPA